MDGQPTVVISRFQLVDASGAIRTGIKWSGWIASHGIVTRDVGDFRLSCYALPLVICVHSKWNEWTNKWIKNNLECFLNILLFLFFFQDWCLVAHKESRCHAPGLQDRLAAYGWIEAAFGLVEDHLPFLVQTQCKIPFCSHFQVRVSLRALTASGNSLWSLKRKEKKKERNRVSVSVLLLLRFWRKAAGVYHSARGILVFTLSAFLDYVAAYCFPLFIDHLL